MKIVEHFGESALLRANGGGCPAFFRETLRPVKTPSSEAQPGASPGANDAQSTTLFSQRNMVNKGRL